MKILEDLIYPVVDEMQDTVNDGGQLLKTPETPLLGAGSALDSLGLVSLIIAIEERIEKQLGRSITLANEKAMSLAKSPFRTIGTLADYISQVLVEEN